MTSLTCRPRQLAAFLLTLVLSVFAGILPAQAVCIILVGPGIGMDDPEGRPRVYRCPPVRMVALPPRPVTSAEPPPSPSSAPVQAVPRKSVRSVPWRSERDRLIARALGQGYTGFRKVYSGQRYTGFRKVYRGQRYLGFEKVYSGPRYPADLYGSGGRWQF